MSNNFHDELKLLIDKYIHEIYDCSQSFPKEENFGVTSQIRRSAISIMLNYVEGYARIKLKILKNFLEISYGSLKENKYLIYFSYKRGYIVEDKYKELLMINDKIGAMLWGIISKLKT